MFGSKSPEQSGLLDVSRHPVLVRSGEETKGATWARACFVVNSGHVSVILQTKYTAVPAATW